MIILYQGKGAQESGMHSKIEFLTIMKDNFYFKNPQKFILFKLEDWIEYVDAKIL